MKVFTASWCAPCAAYKNEIQDVENVEIIDVEERMDLGIAYGVQSVPLTVFEREGEITHRVSGVLPLAQVTSLRAQFE